MDHFDVMKFLKENDARVQRHYEKMQELEQKEKELSFQKIYRNYPSLNQNEQLNENISRKEYSQGQEEPIQFTYELNSNTNQYKKSPNSDDRNEGEIQKEYTYTPINHNQYKASSNYSDNANNSYLSNQRIGYSTNYNNDLAANSSSSINNLNDGMKTSQTAFAVSKLSYNQQNNPNDNYKPIDKHLEFKDNIDTLGTSPLQSQKKFENSQVENSQRQHSEPKKYLYEENQDEYEDQSGDNNELKMESDNSGDIQQSKDEYEKPNSNKNADLNNLLPGSSQNTEENNRIDTKKSKKKTTPRFNSINEDNTLDDNEKIIYNDCSVGKYDPYKRQHKEYEKNYKKNQYQYQNFQNKMNKFSTLDSSKTMNSQKKYHGKMDTVTRMQQYSDYWKKKPFMKKKNKQTEQVATSESRLKMNKLQFITPPLRYYTKM